MDETAAKDLLSDLLGLDGDPDWANVTADAIPAWDSLVHMAIVDEVEQVLQRELEPDELMGLTSYEAIVATLQGRSGRAG